MIPTQPKAPSVSEAKTSLMLLVLCSALAACDSSITDTAPADFERAMLDCAPHGGLVSVTTVYVMFRDRRVDATCKDGAKISREAAA